MRHTAIISDVHLSEGVPGDELWMRYRQRKFFPDEELARLFEFMCEEARGAELELVFNGDLFDFDAPAINLGEGAGPAAPPDTELGAVQVLGAILRDHDVFVASLARVLDLGHSLTFVSGNHDAQLAFPAVRALLRARLCDAVAALRASRGETGDARDAGDRVRFRAWFHRTVDGIHVEHGNQYDKYCSFRYPMEPYTGDGRAVQPTLGSLSVRHLINQMGYFNPHVDSSFMLPFHKYLAHWARYYLFSKRSLGFTWALGSLRIAAAVARARELADKGRAVRTLAACAYETGCDPRAVAEHASLFAPPSADAFHAVARELWLDRAALLVLGSASLALAAAAAPAAGGALLGATLAGAAVYEMNTPKPPLDDTYTHIENVGRRIARLHGARAVIFGHTHRAHGVWEEGVFYGNTGTWSPAFRDVECTQPVTEGRPVVWLRSSPHRAELEGGLYEWRAGMLLRPDERLSRLPTAPPPALEPVRPSLAPEAAREALAG